MAEAKWATEERKLQPAYDDLNASRYKIVDQTLTRYLKKSPKSQPALILRLAYLQRTQASLEVVIKAFEDVKATGELTGRGAWWVNNTLRNIQRWDLIVGLYSDLWGKSPDKAELGEQVFLNAAAAWDTDIMVSSSRKMFNLVKSPVWARVAAWSEWAHKAPLPTPTDPFPTPTTETQSALKISKTLISLSGPKTPSAEVLWLKLQILLSSGDIQGALKVAREGGERGNLGRLWWRMEGVKAGIVRLPEGEQVAEYTKEREWATQLLQTDTEAQRNYAFYRYLIICTTHSPSQTTLDLFTDLHAKIGEKERAPLLASLELDNANVRFGDESSLKNSGGFGALVKGYWTQWGSKGCVVGEIEGICEGEEWKVEEICEMLRGVGDEHSDLQAYREVVNAQLFLLRRQTADWIPISEDVKGLWDLYLSGLQYGRNLPTTDIQPADDVGLAAVQLLLVQYNSNKEESHLLRSLVCLKYIISKSPSCAHGHYLLIKIYRLLGTFNLVIPSATPLDISEVQLDTLTHVISERGALEAHIGGMTDGFEKYAKEAQKMYKRTITDMPEYIKQALENESYSKIHSIHTLSTTLSHSLSHATISLESLKLSILSGQIGQAGIDDLERLLAVEEGGMADTRSWELIPEIGGGVLVTREITSAGNEIDEAWVRLFGKVLLGYAKIINGEKEIVVEIHEAELNSLPATEKAFIAGILAVIRVIQADTGGNGRADEEGGAARQSLADAIKELVNLSKTTTQTSSRWSRLYPCLLLFELSRYIDLALATFSKASTSASNGKSKKKTAVSEQHDLEILHDVKHEWAEYVAPVREMLEGLNNADEEIAWKSLCEDLTDVESIVDSVSKEVVDFRTLVVSNLQKTLRGERL